MLTFLKKIFQKEEPIELEEIKEIELEDWIKNKISQLDFQEEIIQNLLEDKFPRPGSVKNRKSTAPETGKTTWLISSWHKKTAMVFGYVIAGFYLLAFLAGFISGLIGL